jgi:hypothetical protein
MTDHFITIPTAKAMISRCTAQKENILDSSKQDMGIVPMCETFSRDAFDTILSDPNCEGIRIYAAMNSDLTISFIIVGVNSSKEDIFVTDTSQDPAVEGVMEMGVRCPDHCPPSSSINS